MLLISLSRQYIFFQKQIHKYYQEKLHEDHQINLIQQGINHFSDIQCQLYNLLEQDCLEMCRLNLNNKYILSRHHQFHSLLIQIIWQALINLFNFLLQEFLNTLIHTACREIYQQDDLFNRQGYILLEMNQLELQELVNFQQLI